MIKTTCPCGSTYQFKAEYAGKRVKCRKCDRVFFVPGIPLDLRTETFSPPQGPDKNESSQKDTPDARFDRTVDFPKTGREKKNSRTDKDASFEVPGYGFHRILKAHAQGGQGRVFIARDEKLNREVALKEVLPQYASYAEIHRRFTGEAKITARLEHPGIVPIHALGLNDNGRPYYTMKFVHGRTFKEAIREHHRTTENSPKKIAGFRELLRRFASVCQTLAFAHDHGIVHRDLKPANIMLGPHGETLVMDWGLAKPFRNKYQDASGAIAVEILPDRPEMTGEGGVLGTLQYMSPEQAKGELSRMDHRSDIFSLGAILYEILLGSPPIQGSTKEEVLEKAQNASAIPPSQFRRDVPKGLEAVVLKAMAKAPRERYQSAAALFQDITNWLDDEPLLAKKDTLGEKTWRWIRKHKSLTTVFVLILCLVSLLALSGYLLERAYASARAANLLAMENERQLEQARRRLAENERQLASKEEELQNLYSRFLHVPEKERVDLLKKINMLNREIEALERENTALKALIASLQAEEEENAGESGLIERTMSRKLVETLSDIEKAKKELYALSTEHRKHREVLSIAQRKREKEKINSALRTVHLDKSLTDQQREEKKAEILQDLDSSFQALVQSYSRRKASRLQQNQRISAALVYSEWTSILPRDEILAFCDRSPVDWDIVQEDANAVFAGDYLVDSRFETDHFIVQKQKGQYKDLPLIAGRECDQFIFAHAMSHVKIAIPDHALRWTAVGGINRNFLEIEIEGEYTIYLDEMDSNSWTYQIWFDGELAYESDVLSNYPDATVFMDVAIPPGAKTMELIIDSNGDNYGDHSLWAWPRFHLDPDRPEEPSPPAPPPVTEPPEPEIPRLMPIQVDRRTLAPDFLDRLQKVENSIRNPEDYAVAGQILFRDGSPASPGNYGVGVVHSPTTSDPTYHFENGWFISNLPRSSGLEADRCLFVVGFQYDPTKTAPLHVDEGKVNFYRVVLEKTEPGRLMGISGLIRDELNHPVPQVNVDLSVDVSRGYYGRGHRATISTLTDARGQYSFKSITPQPYTLDISKPGYRSGIHHHQQCSPEPGKELKDRDFTMYYHRAVLIETVYQPDGSTDFTNKNIVKGRYVLDTSSSEMVGKDNRTGYKIQFDPTTEPKTAEDIRLEIRDGALQFRHFYSNEQVGHYDAGEIGFESVEQADPKKIRRDTTPCRVGHVYVLRTYEKGNYVKLIVREIRMKTPENTR